MAAYQGSVVLANFIPLSSVVCQFCVLASELHILLGAARRDHTLWFYLFY